MQYAQLHALSNYSFLRSGSHPHELIEEAAKLGYKAIALTDECSLAGIVKAHAAAKRHNIKLLVGSEFTLSNGARIVVIAPSKKAYAELSGFITLSRRRSAKGCYESHFDDLYFRLQHCFIVLVASINYKHPENLVENFHKKFSTRLWLGINQALSGHDKALLQQWEMLGNRYQVPLLACDLACMHAQERKQLLDSVHAIKENISVREMGTRLSANSEAYLKPLHILTKRYPKSLLLETSHVASMCQFSMDELHYQYPEEVVPKGLSPSAYLRQLVEKGMQTRWPDGIPEKYKANLEKELALVKYKKYEYYFLTVYDIVSWARSQSILCQGRGSAANSIICYCLYITEISPEQISALFERFISKDRNEPPDIDVDFEHERREEVIQYIYQKYGRERAALAATVVCYRTRSAIRDVGKALDIDALTLSAMTESLAWWEKVVDLKENVEAAGLNIQDKTLEIFFQLVQEIKGFPRHLSQHTGGFVITQDKTSNIVPLENASMPDRTIIQWDKEDLEEMELMKVDVLALGMLTALRKTMQYVRQYDQSIMSLMDIPEEDPHTYAMLSRGDSVGVFQVESRAQMTMLPRLRPKTFYDLVIEIAIVRPGPIQGDMVHPYLRRRNGEEPVTYKSPKLRSVLDKTLGIPIFQEQVMNIAMVSAGFSGNQADDLRRAMTSWGKNRSLLRFEKMFINGMLKNGYDLDYAVKLFEQIKGFGGYGFPESHSASFALLCYFSSWFKYHHPAAFCCGLLNSQPMGFYSASQLIQDARRHGINIYPIDVNISDIDNTLEKLPKTSGRRAEHWGIRLGLCRVKSLPAKDAQLVIDARKSQLYTSAQDLKNRSGISTAGLEALASADALINLSGHRHQAHWDIAAVSGRDDLIEDHHGQADLWTRAPNTQENLLEDIASTGLSLRQHPMALLRQQALFKRCKRYSELSELSTGRFVQVAGLVTGRQRPGTAKGSVFLTLEDETGNINVIVWKSTQELFKKALLTSKILLVKGRVETRESVVHVIAGRLIDCSSALDELLIKSRDFH